MKVGNPASKILDRTQLLERFGRPREGRIVFTNGCFDILHRGHVEYLARARALGDALVVGLNTDDSVRRLEKGGDRPFNREEDRALVLASLEIVDAVSLFGEDTPMQLIQALVPDVLVKGGDYGIEQVVGRKVVEAAGGEVRILPFVKGFSTTDLVNRIRNAAP
jgi:rfaE bifunctional protein nucleotidyltransferase chain/domain